MNKRFLLISVLMLVMVLTACSSNNANNAEANKENNSGNEANKTIKFGHTFSESDQMHEAVGVFKEEVENLSDGKMTVDIYANSSLGSVKDLVDQTKSGNVDAFIGGISYFAGEYPEALIDEIPFLYENEKHWFAAMDGELGEKINTTIFEDQGLTNLGSWGMGSRHFTNNIKPINTPEDMKGIKFRSEDSPIRIEMFDALDASAVALPFNEVFTALQQGIIDGQENPATVIASNSFEEVQSYLSLTGHIYSGVTVLFNKDMVDGLSDEEQEWVMEAMDKATEFQRSNTVKANEESLEALKEDMEVNEVDQELFRDAVKPVYDFYNEKVGDNGWLELIEDAR